MRIPRLLVPWGLSALLFSAAHADPIPSSPIGKVIAVYPDRDTTKFIVESRDPMVAGRMVYVGPDSVPVTLGDLLSRTEQYHYYGASVPGKPKIDKGDAVSSEKKSSGASALQFRIEEKYVFEQKRRAAITAVQGVHAMIDRGTLHEVRERDIYRLYDSSGRYKGLLEVAGLGDLQSSGKLYNRLEDRRRNALTARPGDRAVFAGQRKLFALGLMGGIRSTNETVINEKETTFGGGLLWNVTFQDGWGAEVLFGGFSREGKGKIETFSGPFFTLENLDQGSRTAKFIAPIWLKKNFFYPSVVSPFLGAGLSLFTGKNEYSRFVPGSTEVKGSKTVTTVVPVLGGGVEFFPGRFFRPRIEARYFRGPKIDAGGNIYNTESLFYSFGFLTAW